MAVQGDRANTGEVRRLRPMATVTGGMSAALVDLQRGLTPQAEAALLRRLDRPGKPPGPVLDRLWAWASPDEGGTTQLDSLARDRCALACALWMAKGDAALRALGRGDDALVQMLRELHQHALQGARDRTTHYPDARSVDARLEATQAWLQRIEAPARSRLGALLLAWSAPASVTLPQLMRALADGDSVARAHVPGNDDLWLATLRCYVRAVGRPVAAALLRQLAPVFLQAAHDLGIQPPTLDGHSAGGLLRMLEAVGQLPEDKARALAQDARRLPWSTDPPSVRIYCILACLDMIEMSGSGAMDLVCARASRLALQKAAVDPHAAQDTTPRHLASLRLATLYGAYSVRLGQLARGEEPGASVPGGVERLHVSEFAALNLDGSVREVLENVAARPFFPQRVAGLRVLNLSLASHDQQPKVSSMAVLAACERPQPLDGRTMVVLLEACDFVTLSGRASAEAKRLHAVAMLRLLMAPMPANVHRLTPLVEGLLGAHACREHAPPSYASAVMYLELIEDVLTRATTAAQRSTLCLVVGEALYGLNCRYEAGQVALAALTLPPGAWSALLLRLVEDNAYPTRRAGERIRMIEDVAARYEALPDADRTGGDGPALVRVSDARLAKRAAVGQAVEAAFSAGAAAGLHGRLLAANGAGGAVRAPVPSRLPTGAAEGELNERTERPAGAEASAREATPPALAEATATAAVAAAEAARTAAAAEAHAGRQVAAPQGPDGYADFTKQKAARRASAPGPAAFTWRLGAGELTSVALPEEGASSPAKRLRGALQRELEATDVGALSLVIEDCAAHLRAWMGTVGFSDADFALLPGELEMLGAAAVTLSRWRRKPRPRQVAHAALRLGAALVFGTLGPPPQHPYWAADDGRGRHYRALFAVVAGVHGSTAAERAQLKLRLARQHLTVRRGAAFGFAEA